jgi:hypothetical protein
MKPSEQPIEINVGISWEVQQQADLMFLKRLEAKGWEYKQVNKPKRRKKK